MVATFADGSEAVVELAGCDTGINMAVYRVKQSDISQDTRNKLKIITRKVVRENALGSRILAVGQPMVLCIPLIPALSRIISFRCLCRILLLLCVR